MAVTNRGPGGAAIIRFWTRITAPQGGDDFGRIILPKPRGHVGECRSTQVSTVFDWEVYCEIVNVRAGETVEIPAFVFHFRLPDPGFGKATVYISRSSSTGREFRSGNNREDVTATICEDEAPSCS
jgi:hypothetical protein